MSLENSVRVWMRDVLSDRDISAERWAKLAGTSGTNVTRFLGGADHVPSLRTIAKLAAVAGSWPALGRGGIGVAPAEVRVPLVPARSLAVALREGVTERDGMTLCAVHVGTQGVAFHVPADGARMIGSVRPGDVLVVEPLAFRSLNKLSLVVAVQGDTILVGRYLPPFIMGGDDALGTLDDSEVVGVVMEQRRAHA